MGFANSSATLRHLLLITRGPEDVAALAETVVVFEAGRVSRVLSLAGADKPRLLSGLLSSYAA